MIKPDRRNGNIISDNNNSKSIVRLIAIILTIILTLYEYGSSDNDPWWWWIGYPLLIFAISEYVLQLILEPLIKKQHNSPKKKKYYFRSGISICKDRYNQLEKDTLVERQKDEPILFITKNGEENKKYYWRFKNRTWISKEEASVKEIKDAIKNYNK